MFDHKKAQNKWSKYWIDNKIFKTDTWDFSKPKYYVLDMFPYPSGVGLHTGHAEAFTAPDVVGRMKKMQGYNVLHAMGFDSFGLPAEQYAISTGNHPSIITEANIKTFSSQLKEMGFGLDWDRVISTCDPSYYKWTQWIFIQLFKDGVAKQVNMPVNWCEELGCVLSNDEVIDGKSERGGFPVIRKNMKQWVIDIPQYAERLLSGLNEIDFPESTKEIERNWIGKSIGAEVIFKIDNSSYDFTVFTTRCDTLFGATYCVLSPEHVLVDKITTEEKSEEVNKYKEICARKSDLERTELNKEKSGVFTGAYAINPVNNKKIPIWISDYVLSSYGTGAIMAVPAHDERDYEFAKKFNIEIIEVLKGGDISNQAFTEDGIHINSEFLNGLGKEESISKMISWLEEHKCGKQKINYKMREWIFARQRYWGEPIPIVELENGDLIAIDEKDLPLILPELKEYAPDKNGNSPLDKAKEWINVTIDGKKGKRETSTMPGSAGSSWYYFRYIDPFNDKCIADKELLKHWMPVDLYVGGPEHAVGHLLFSRMWCNYLYDKGISPVKEPYKKLFHQGMILGSNGIKMGKRYPEYSVNPSDMVEKYGSDALRLYLMFMGPLEADKPWNNNGIEGARRFIDRVWRLFEDNKIVDKDILNLEKVYNETIKKVTKDYESLSINTAISQMMIFINSVYKEGEFPKKYAEGFIKIFSPLCPFISEEMWSYLGYSNSVALESWPIYDESKIVDDKITIAVSINGKLRTTLLVDSDIKEEELKKMVFNDDVIEKNIQGKEIIKTIVVPKKIVNIVVKG